LRGVGTKQSAAPPAATTAETETVIFSPRSVSAGPPVTAYPESICPPAGLPGPGLSTYYPLT